MARIFGFFASIAVIVKFGRNQKYILASDDIRSHLNFNMSFHATRMTIKGSNMNY